MNKFTTIKTSSNNTDFKNLTKELDHYLEIQNGDDNQFFVQYNKIDNINYVLIAYQGNDPIGCGAIRQHDTETIEIKRMFVRVEYRRQGVANEILNELLRWAAELGYKRCVLETGDKMIEAINLYRICGFERIDNYEPYSNVESSLCFEKVL